MSYRFVCKTKDCGKELLYDPSNGDFGVFYRRPLQDEVIFPVYLTCSNAHTHSYSDSDRDLTVAPPGA